MNLMNELLDCLNSISYEVFDEDYINELLDNRDDDLFDSEWCRVFKEIEALKNIQNYTDKVKKEQHKIREEAFMIIIENNADGEDWHSFISNLYENIKNGKYKKSQHHYQIPLTKTQRNMAEKNNIPNIFLNDV